MVQDDGRDGIIGGPLEDGLIWSGVICGTREDGNGSRMSEAKIREAVSTKYKIGIFQQFSLYLLHFPLTGETVPSSVEDVQNLERSSKVWRGHLRCR